LYFAKNGDLKISTSVFYDIIGNKYGKNHTIKLLFTVFFVDIPAETKKAGMTAGCGISNIEF
jgi:hypothetical protein